MVDFDKITQRQLEDYFKAFREFGGSDEKSIVENAGASARAAQKIGWLETFDVDNAEPQKIMKIYVEILQGTNKALLPPSKN